MSRSALPTSLFVYAVLGIMLGMSFLLPLADSQVSPGWLSHLTRRQRQQLHLHSPDSRTSGCHSSGWSRRPGRPSGTPPSRGVQSYAQIGLPDHVAAQARQRVFAGSHDCAEQEPELRAVGPGGRRWGCTVCRVEGETGR